MFAVALLMSTLTVLADGRIYDRCELARDLQLLGVDNEQIATWVCIAYHESRYDTAAQNYGSGDHGLLQISELYWCGPGKACGAPCSAFRDEDISDDVKCALQIHKEHTRLQGDGFLAWVVYPHHCKQNAKKYIIDCDKNIKNTPVKYDDRARHLKTPVLRNESKPQVVNNPYQNSVTPRYLSINSIFQGSYINEFERNYYDNDKQSNWLNFKVDNIDDLQLPGTVSVKQRPYFIQSTTRAPQTTLDPNLIGIKPPSPRRIESNQFRRRKTFSQPLFLKNRFSGDQKISKTTPAPIREYSENTLLLNEDLSQNVFLKLSPSVISKSLKEFSPHEIKSADLSKYHVKTPQVEESPSSTVLKFEDLAQNPFLNFLPGFNFKSKTESPTRVSDFGQNHFRGFTFATSRPVDSLSSSKQIGHLQSSESSKKFLQSEAEDTAISIEDLAQNPFLSHLFHVNNVQSSTESIFYRNYPRENYRKEFSFSTTKPALFSSQPSTKSSFLEEIITPRTERFELSAKIPTTAQRGRTHYMPNFDKLGTQKPSTERPTTLSYSTRQYQTISRQRPITNQNELKSTSAMDSTTEKLKVSSTAKPYTNYLNRGGFKIESTTSRTKIAINETFSSLKDLNNVAAELRSKQIQQTTNRTVPTTKTIPYTTKRPETASTIKILDTTKNTITPLADSIETANESKTTFRPWTTRRQSTSRLTTTSRPWIVTKTENIRRLQSYNSTKIVSASQNTREPPTTNRLNTIKSTLWTTKRPHTISRTTNGPLTTSTQQTTKRSEVTSKPILSSTETISRLQTTSKKEATRSPRTTIGSTTSRPTTTTRPWTPRRFWEESRINNPTTPRPSFTWKRPTNVTSTTTARYSSTSTQTPSTIGTEKSTMKTTLSIFDLYLRPSTPPPFKPFEFTSFNKLRKGISIFSGGTTKSPPTYLTNKKQTTEDFPRN